MEIQITQNDQTIWKATEHNWKESWFVAVKPYNTTVFMEVGEIAPNKIGEWVVAVTDLSRPAWECKTV